MVKLLKQSSISLQLETQGQRADYKGTNEREPKLTRYLQTKISVSDLRTKDNILLKPKDDRTYGERVDESFEAGCGS